VATPVNRVVVELAHRIERRELVPGVELLGAMRSASD